MKTKTKPQHSPLPDPRRKVFDMMLYRCRNPRAANYKYYGGRGVKVCAEWLAPKNGFLNFCKDMGNRPSLKYTIDRIDNTGHYEPDNCRWILKEENSRRAKRFDKFCFRGHPWIVSKRSQCHECETIRLKKRTLIARAEAVL